MVSLGRKKPDCLACQDSSPENASDAIPGHVEHVFERAGAGNSSPQLTAPVVRLWNRALRLPEVFQQSVFQTLVIRHTLRFRN